MKRVGHRAPRSAPRTQDDAAQGSPDAGTVIELRVGQSAVGSLGISQSGWIATVASRRGADPSLIVMLQGPAVSLEEQESHRVRYSMQSDGLSQPAIDSAIEYTHQYFNFVNTSTKWNSLQASAQAASAASRADYVNLASSPDDEDILWWRRNTYDPADDLRTLTCPVLALFGEDDNAVPPAENQQKMEQYLTEARVPHSVIVIREMPHSVTTYHGLRGGEWNWPGHFWVWSRRPIAMDSAMVDWVRRQTEMQ